MASKQTSQLFLKLSSGANMPLLGFGTFQLREPNQLRTALKTAISTGYRHIDTAFAYENEHIIGQTLQRDIFDKRVVRREDLFITTKLFSSFHRRHRVIDALRAQLKALSLKYVDLYLIHFPIPFYYEAGDNRLVHVDNVGRIVTDPVCKLEDTWKGMEDCVKAGLAKSIGVSNCNAIQVDRIKQSGTIPPAINQIELHPAFQNTPLMLFCKQNDVAVTAYSPFGSPGTRCPETGRPISDLNLLDHPILAEIGSKYGKTPAQVILRWLIQRNISVVAKSATPNRIVDNFQIWDFSLDANDLTAISHMNMNRRVMAAVVPGVNDHPEYPFKYDDHYAADKLKLEMEKSAEQKRQLAVNSTGTKF